MMSKKSAKQLVMTPLYRQRVVKAKKGKGSYCRKQKPRTEFRGFCFQGPSS
jgi:stalled ribosome alternative rescue factor ArfA